MQSQLYTTVVWHLKLCNSHRHITSSTYCGTMQPGTLGPFGQTGNCLTKNCLIKKKKERTKKEKKSDMCARCPSLLPTLLQPRPHPSNVTDICPTNNSDCAMSLYNTTLMSSAHIHNRSLLFLLTVGVTFFLSFGSLSECSLYCAWCSLT